MDEGGGGCVAFGEGVQQGLKSRLEGGLTAAAGAIAGGRGLGRVWPEYALEHVLGPGHEPCARSQ